MNFMNRWIVGLAALTLGVCGTSASQAAVLLVNPVGVIADSQQSAPRNANNTIDGVGLSTTPTAANVLTVNHDQSPIEGFATDTLLHGGMWLANATTGVITFDLGSARRIGAMYIWNYGELSQAGLGDNTFRSAKSVDVFSASSLNASPIGGGDTLIQSFVFAKAAPPLAATANIVTEGGNTFSADYNTPVDVYTFDSPVSAQFIKFRINTNYGDGSFVGLAEVRFEQVPEPASAGVVMVGGAFLLRRKR